MGCRTPGLMLGPQQAPPLKSEMLRAAELVGGWRQTHPLGDNCKNKTKPKKQLIAIFPFLPPTLPHFPLLFVPGPGI